MHRSNFNKAIRLVDCAMFFAIAFVMSALFFSTPAFALPQSPDEYKALLNGIPAMFVAMVLGSVAYGLIQTRQATLSGKPMGFLTFFTYGREVVIGGIINVAAFALLLVADQLTFVGAFTLGITGSALSDFGSGGRSADLAKAPEEREGGGAG